MKNFKVFYFAIAFIGASFFTQNVQAQMSAGAGLSYGFEIEELGLNLRFNYGITEKINANANFTFWFIGEEGVSFSTFNIDGHYYFHSSEKF